MFSFFMILNFLVTLSINANRAMCLQLSYRRSVFKGKGEMNCESITQNCAMLLGLNTQNNRFEYHFVINVDRNASLGMCALGRYILGNNKRLRDR